MIHINKFIDSLRFFDSNNSKEFKMSMKDAHNLHSDITKLLSALHSIKEDVSSTITDNKTTINGGKW